MARVHGLGSQTIEGVASFGVRPTIESHGQVLLEVHCFQWPNHLGLEGGYGKIVQVDLLHKLHDERHYESLQALKHGIQLDIEEAREWFKSVKK